jgi:hypothetical protein
MLPTVDLAGPVLLLIIVGIVSCVGLCVAVALVGCLLWLVARRRPVRSPLFGASRPEFQRRAQPVEHIRARRPINRPEHR